MGVGKYKRARSHKNIKDFSKKYRTRRRTKDQIHLDLKKKVEESFTIEPDEDLPGLGQFYCIECTRHFIDEPSLTLHFKSKNHKKRLKVLQEEPYTQKEAERAAGMSH